MPSVFNPDERNHLIQRIGTLKPDARPLWGRMNAHQMVCHLTAAIESGFEGPPVSEPSGVMSHFPLNWLVIHVLPWPKGKAQSPPELLDRVPTTWDADLARLQSSLERAAARGPEAEWRATPVFGAISGRTWGALLRKHVDHHLRQFGS